MSEPFDTLEQAWRHFERDVLRGLPLPPGMLRSVRSVFYAGATAAFTLALERDDGTLRMREHEHVARVIAEIDRYCNENDK